MTRIRTGPWTGAPLAAMLAAKGLSRPDLARLMRSQPGCARVSAETIRQWLPPRSRAPNATMFAAVARVLGVNMDRLMEVAADPKPDPAR